MRLRQLWFPSVCAACGADLQDGEHIVCKNCLEQDEYRLTAPFSVRGADGADAPLVYKDAVRRAMHAYKFHARRAYADGFAAHAGDCLRAHLADWEPDVVTFVPHCPGRRMKGGWPDGSGCPANRCSANGWAFRCSRSSRTISAPKISGMRFVCVGTRGLPDAGCCSWTISSPPARPLRRALVCCGARALPRYMCSV